MKNLDVDKLDAREFIIVKNARVNNLKNLSVAIPRNKMVVITGLSGSGKSSLAFDTLYADGQRRYVESLSAYARQFLGRMSKPEVDYIKGISPAVAIEQRVNSRNPRSTVGTSTEIYEYLKLLFARIGKTFSPLSGNQVTRNTVTDVVNAVLNSKSGTSAYIMSPLILKAGRSVADQLNLLQQQGFTRLLCNDEILKIEQVAVDPDKFRLDNVKLLIDRIIVDFIDQDELSARVADSAQTAFFEGEGQCDLLLINESVKTLFNFSNHFDLDGITFEEPTVNLFSFNNPFGACKVCEGFGSIIGIDEDLVVPDKSLSVYEDAIACWKGEKMGEYKETLINNAHKFSFPVHTPYSKLSDSETDLLWNGNEFFEGIKDFFRMVESQTYKIQYRVMLSRYRGKTVCPDCKGTRLRKDAGYVKVGGKSISELVLMPLSEVLDFMQNLKISEHETLVASRILTEIKNRLTYLNNVGLNYLNLNRLSNTLSGGESQRINLATSLGSSLVGSMYILDEPSIGLHPRDTYRLINVMKGLRDIGNTVIVVEHDAEVMKAADELIDIGPLAGSGGGSLVFQGPFSDILSDNNSLTGKYLSGKMNIEIPANRRKWHDYIELKGVRENNLKNIDVKFPLKTLTVVTGVSGSGKTSLVRKCLYPALKREFNGYGEKYGKFDKLDGDYKLLAATELVDQNPIGRSSRSNPATYIKAYDDIRNMFADQQLAKVRGYKPGYFSFNIEGGRCEECEGEGTVTVEMQFMADIHLLCDTCRGKRFKDEVLDVKVLGASIHDVLEMTVDEALELFSSENAKNSYFSKITAKLKPLADVGLGYLKLGQSSDTFSGGEAQRIKLASFLTKGTTQSPTLFIFDEPTTGLHFHDISKLLVALNELIQRGHSVLIIEHNPDVIKAADWIIDLGPEGGSEGGKLLFEGTPEELVKCRNSYTGKYIRL